MAYTLLKGLTPEELASLTEKRPSPGKPKPEHHEQPRRHEETEKSRNTGKIDGILSRYEAEISDYMAGRKTGDDSDMRALIFRMKSRKPKVINAALKHSAQFVNRTEFRKALTEILRRPEIDASTAEIAGALPFDDTTRKLIAMDTSGNAGNFPAGLIISLIGSDTDAMESMLLHVSPENVAVILRRWPSGKNMNAGIVRSLLASDDARILVPLLGAMRTNFPRSAQQHRKRLAELESHPVAAVRAWSRKLL